MKKILSNLGYITFGAIVLMFAWFGALIFYAKYFPKELIVILEKEYQPTRRCYFQSTFGDVVREEELDCKKYEPYTFNTIHWDSLPHGFIK